MSWRTKNNYNGFDVLSAIQKEIRRGNAEDAMFWALELIESGNDAVVFNRLKVIAHEDIGTGDIQKAMFAIKSAEDASEFYKNNKRSWRLALANAILSLSSAEKSRDADNFQAAIRNRIRKIGGNKEIPDYVFDKHTYKGKKMGRGVKHFVEEATKLDKDNSNEEWKEEAKEMWEFEASQKYGKPSNNNGMSKLL